MAMLSSTFKIGVLLVGLTLGSCSAQLADLARLANQRSCVECNLEGVNLSGQNFSVGYQVSVTNPPLNVDPRNLSKVEPVDLTRSNLRGANLSNSVFQGAILTETDLQEANLEGADLRETQLNRANLTDAILVEADLRQANLENAIVNGADLRGADLRQATLNGVDLSTAITDAATQTDRAIDR